MWTRTAYAIGTALLIVGSSSATAQKGLQPTINHPAKPPLSIRSSYTVEDNGPGWLTVQVYARNNGTKPISFHLNLPCTSELKLYPTAAHTGIPIHFLPESDIHQRPGMQTGYVDVTLAPKQSHSEECGHFNMEKLVQGNTGTVSPGIYYPVIHISQLNAALIDTTEALSSMIAVGSYAKDTVRIGPLRVTGTSQVEGQGVRPIFTILNTQGRIDDVSSFVTVADGSDLCYRRIALYQDEAHSGIPFRYVAPKGMIHFPHHISVPLDASGVMTTGCGGPIPLDRLMRNGQPITPGVYYVTYEVAHDYRSGKTTTLDLGRITIP